MYCVWVAAGTNRPAARDVHLHNGSFRLRYQLPLNPPHNKGLVAAERSPYRPTKPDKRASGLQLKVESPVTAQSDIDARR